MLVNVSLEGGQSISSPVPVPVNPGFAHFFILTRHSASEQRASRDWPRCNHCVVTYAVPKAAAESWGHSFIHPSLPPSSLSTKTLPSLQRPRLPARRPAGCGVGWGGGCIVSLGMIMIHFQICGPAAAPSASCRLQDLMNCHVLYQKVGENNLQMSLATFERLAHDRRQFQDVSFCPLFLLPPAVRWSRRDLWYSLSAYPASTT